MLSATCHRSPATFRHRALCSEAIAAQRASALEPKMANIDPKPCYSRQMENGVLYFVAREKRMEKI